MGITLSGLGAGPTGSEPLTSWSGDVSDGAAEIANSSAYPLVRVVTQADSALAAPTEHASTGAGWRIPSPANMGAFSAVCWMFGRRLQMHLGVPVGLIQNDVGGTAVERWSSAEALGRCDQGRATNWALSGFTNNVKSRIPQKLARNRKTTTQQQNNTFHSC